MKVIDLLNKYANNEEMPEYIIYDTKKYVDIVYDYKEIDDKGNIDEQSSWFENLDFYKLDEEVEIIEENKKIKKIEKLYKYIDKEVDEKEKDMYYENILKVYDDSEYEIDESISFIVDKINEIIDYLEDKQC